MGVVVGDVDFNAFAIDLDHLLQKYHGTPLKKVFLGEYLSEVMKVMNQHHMRMLPNFALLTVTMWSAEGLIRDLDPDFEIFEAAKPYVESFILERMNPISRLKDIGRNMSEYYDFFDGFPRRAERMMSKIEKGELKIIFRDERLERLNVVIDQASNRLILGAIISTIILSYSLIIFSGKNPFFLGLPLLDLLILIAVLLGLILTYLILRPGKY
jgi:ubiquinone biosynthesis protein